MRDLARRLAGLIRRGKDAAGSAGSAGAADDGAAEGRVADPQDPAVALAMKILAEEGATGDEAALEAELEAAKLAYDAAAEEAREAALARLSRATVRAALARQMRKKFEG
jgi:hypothetical protein